MKSNSENKVYNHVEKISVKSMHSETTNYLVCYGYVDWNRDGDLKAAIYILMEYNGYIKYTNPPHILTTIGEDGRSDFVKVMEQVNFLKEKYNL